MAKAKAKAGPSKLVRIGGHTFRVSLVERGKLTEEKGSAPAKQKRRRKAKARKAPRKASRRRRRGGLFG